MDVEAEACRVIDPLSDAEGIRPSRIRVPRACWLDPAFRGWNIEPAVANIDVPLLSIQGRDDEYGTLAQLDASERQASMRVERAVFDDCRHSPQRDQPERTLAAITSFIAALALY